MIRNPIRRLVLLFLLLPLPPIRAEEPALRDLLRDALYTEEVTRDPEKAAKQYEGLLSRHDAQKQFAAAALFRLAEVRRKQDRKDDAIKLYQRLIAEFPSAEAETKLAKENLAALGGKMPEAGGAAESMDDFEKRQLAQLEEKAKSSPDVLLDSNELSMAASQGLSKIVKRMLSAGCDPYGGDALKNAADTGNLEIVKLLTESKNPVPDEIASAAILTALQRDRFTILEYLLNKGLKPGVVDGSFGKGPVFVQAVLENRLKGAEILLQHGADVNAMVASSQSGAFVPCGTALHLVLVNQFGRFEGVDWLLRNGAKPDLADPWFGLTPLHYASMSDRPEGVEIIGKLLAAGANPNHRAADRAINDDFKNNYLRGSTPLETAIAFSGARLEKTKLFLKHGAKPDPNGLKLAKALAWAMANPSGADALELIEVLGNGGFPMSDPSLMETALKSNEPKIIEALLKHGADPNVKTSNGRTLFEDACVAGNVERVKLLLKNGADPKQPGLLSALIQRGPEAIPTIKILLEAGADPNAVDNSKRPPIVNLFEWDFENKNSGNVYLHSDKRSDQAKLLELLLKHGVDPNTTYYVFSRMPISNDAGRGGGSGGSPFMEEMKEPETLPKSLLMMVVGMEKSRRVINVDMIGMLLDAGAKPTHEFPEVFSFVAKGDDSLTIAKALLPFRPQTLNLDRTNIFLNWNPQVKRLFLDEVLNPVLAGKRGVHFVFSDRGEVCQWVGPNEEIPDTALLLFRHWSEIANGCAGSSGKAHQPVLALVRRDGSGAWSRTKIDLASETTFQGLQAGDVIELSRGEESPLSAAGGIVSPFGISQTSAFANWLRWMFRKRVAFPVEVELAGETRQIMLRGDLLSYDPTRKEAPLLSAGHLAMLFLPGSAREGRRGVSPDSILILRRKDGAEVRMDLSGTGANEFEVRPGDRLVLPDPQQVMKKVHPSLRPVVLKVPGIPGVRTFSPISDSWIEGKPSIIMPTLVQVLTDAYGIPFVDSAWIGAAFNETALSGMSAWMESGNVPVILPHPDFSSIRIRRTDGEGKENVLEVDLARAAKGVSPDTPDAQARQVDVPLLPGDVVELPLRNDQQDQPWRGFSTQEELFFRKVLSGTLLIRKEDGIIESISMNYHQPDWKDTPHGLIPWVPKEGVKTMRFSAFSSRSLSSAKLTRNGERFPIGKHEDPFLRDGDMVDFSVSTMRQGQQPPPQQRPRVTPPPPSN